MTLSWQAYATWLMATEGKDMFEALSTVSGVYARQTKKEFEIIEAEEIQKFIEENS